MLKDQFVGTWKLAGTEFRGSDGTLYYPYGKEASGFIIYDADGHMAVQIMGSDRPRFASDDMQGGSPDEAKAAFDRYIAYFGTYTVDETQSRVIHHMQGALLPNWVGRDQIRQFKFEGNRLTLTTPPTLRGGNSLVGMLIWERMTETQG